MDVKNINDLNETDLRNLLDGIDDIILDIDGVIWSLYNEPLRGISETLQKLKQIKKNIYFASNNNEYGISRLHQMLTKYIPDLPEENVLIPSKAIISYLKSINFNKEIFLSSSPYMIQDFKDAGFVVADCGPPISPYGLGEYLKTMVKHLENVGCVIIDFDVNINHMKLCKMLNCLKNKDVLFITGSNAKNVVIRGDIRILAMGDIEQLLGTMLNRLSISFGKPNEQFKNYVNECVKINNPSRTLFVGDMLDIDICFGKSCGFKTLLVLSGISHMQDLENCRENEKPDFYIDNFGELSNILEVKLNL